MYGYAVASELVSRELDLQGKLALHGGTDVYQVPCLLGPVGGGKTSIGKDQALNRDLMLCAINSGENSDATDLSGVPDIASSMLGRVIELLKNKDAPTPARDEARMLYMQWVLNRYAALACQQPVLLFFDDLDKAPPPVQSAMLGILSNRMFRDKPIHPGTLILCAGNREDDDILAGTLSESLRTRMTVIEMTPDVDSFSGYAQRPSTLRFEIEADADARAIHPKVVGFLQYKPDMLHKKDEGYRFPTPRGWWEVSRQFYAWPDPNEVVGASSIKGRSRGEANWKGIVARKCGLATGNDFWAWHEVLSKVDVKKIFSEGVLDATVGSDERRMLDYAAIFAIAHSLKAKVSASYKGLEIYVSGLTPELQVALMAQLDQKARTELRNKLPNVSSALMKHIIRTSNSTAGATP